jgi:hypothetical protein
VTFDQAHHTWSIHVDRGCAFGRSLPAERYFELRYEDLVTDDLALSTEMFSFLGVDLDPAVEGFCRAQQARRTPFKGPTRDLEKGVKASDWANILSPQEQARTLDLIGSHLVRYGYDTEESLKRLREWTIKAAANPGREPSATSAGSRDG